MWQGYSVGRWEGDTLVVESNGFNDKTWLNNVGLPHTEKLRVTERYTRPSLGRLNVDVTYDDPDAYNKPLKVSLRMRLVTDTEMLEEVCEAKQEFWTGSVSDLEKNRVQVSEADDEQGRRLLRRVLAGQPSQGDDVAQGRRAARHGPARSGSGAS